jgi:hypothetical protein
MKKILLSAISVALMSSSALADGNLFSNNKYDFNNVDSYQFSYYKKGGATESDITSFSNTEGAILFQVGGSNGNLTLEEVNKSTRIVDFGGFMGKCLCVYSKDSGFADYVNKNYEGANIPTDASSYVQNWFNIDFFFQGLNTSKPVRLKVVYAMYKPSSVDEVFNSNNIRGSEGAFVLGSFTLNKHSANSEKLSTVIEYTYDLDAGNLKSNMFYDMQFKAVEKGIIIKSVELKNIDKAVYTSTSGESKEYTFDGVDAPSFENKTLTTYKSYQDAGLKVLYAIGWAEDTPDALAAITDAGLNYTQIITSEATADDDVWQKDESNVQFNNNSSSITAPASNVVSRAGSDEVTATVPVVFIKAVGGVDDDLVFASGKFKVNASGTLTGRADIEVADEDAPAQYFNLNGVRVNGDNLPAGLYIRRQGGKATKVVVR